MHRKTVSGIMLTLLSISTLAFVFNFASVGGEGQSLTMVEKAVNFLISYQFNEGLGLCREAPNVKPNTYWLVSDNLWAWKALTVANKSGISGYVEAGRVANIIEAKLKEKAEIHNLPTDPNGFPISFMHEAVIGDTIPAPNHTCTTIQLQHNDYQVLTEVCNRTIMNDWMNYSDRLLYMALSCHWQGNDTAAIYYFELAKAMWDGIGINDTATKNDGFYATYKLALLLYTSKVLGAKLPFEFDLIKKIYTQQRETDGGIITDYYPNGEPVEYADANTETTSIVIISILTPSKTIIVPDDYPAIQEAINNAGAGDVIYVKAGIYEENIVINESISLIGESRETTIIDGNGSGWVVKIECSYVTFGNFTVRNAHEGIWIYEASRQDKIKDNVVRDCHQGIEIRSFGLGTQNHLLQNNIIINNTCGIDLWGCRNVTILQNTIINSGEIGIDLICSPYQPPERRGSYDNLICCNDIIGNKVGIYLLGENNKFYHNNFLNNSENVQVYYVPYYENEWDDGYPSGGNYWSDYAGVDSFSGPYQNAAGSDGIGDTSYIIDENNLDRYPLMGSFNSFNTSVGYSVDVISNSTVEDFTYFDSNSTIVMHVSNMTVDQVFGFCRITIPHELMPPPYTVKVNDTVMNFQTIYENYTEGISTIYFTYEHSKLEITIIPECPSAIILSLFTLTTIIATILLKRKRKPKHQRAT